MPKEKAAAKKPRKTRTRKVTKITTEKEFQESLPSKNKAPFAILDVSRSIIHAIMYCECGISMLKLQGPLGEVFTCDRCGSHYALDKYVGVSKLTEAQKEFLSNKKGMEFK